MYEVVGSLNYLHSGGASNYMFFHRDIKPGNICLDTNFTAKLMVCGLAKLVEDLLAARSVRPSLLQTSGAQVFGTPGYICPWYGSRTKDFQASCDVYSFDVLGLELIVGTLQEGQSGERDLGHLVDECEDESDFARQVVS